MPLLNHGNRRSQQAGNAGEVGKLDYRIGNATHGQGVYLTGSESIIPVEGTEQLWVSTLKLVPYGATSGALDANDALGDMVTFDAEIETGKEVPKHGRILSIRMIDQDDDTLAATIHIYTRAFPTAIASDAAWEPLLGNAPYQVAAELFDAGTDEINYKIHVIKNVNVEYYAPEGKLYAQLSSTGTPNIASAAVMPLLQISILPLP